MPAPVEEEVAYSLDQLTSLHWPSFGEGENKGSVLLCYSCFDRSILMFLMREGLECRISMLKLSLMRLWNDINQLTFVFPFADTRSIKRMWRQLTERIDPVSAKGKTKVSWLISFHSLIRQCFSILIRHCNPSRIRNIKIERSKQLYHNNTLPLFSPLLKLRQWMWRQLTERICITKVYSRV